MTGRPVHLVVMGVSGSGKSTLGRALGQRLGWRLIEGDDFHPPANVAKMRGGVPLTDEDRWPWLARLRDELTAQARAGQGSVLSCSALKRRYRDLLRGAEGEVRFVYLHASREVLETRLRQRRGHFMPATLLDSQLATLEEPQPNEGALTLDAGAPLKEQVREIQAWLIPSPAAAS